MEVEVRARGDDTRSDAVDGSQRTLGRYRVVAELGRGSTSIVYLVAVDRPGGFSKLFALKQLRRALAEDPAFVAMFLTEARIGAQLNHPNVVSTLEIEESDSLPYIVMEYLDGQPLQRLVTSARLAFTPLPLHVHLASLSDALEGLAHAHDARGADGKALEIVHRDVSPHNVFVTASGTTKLLDFGFAQTADSPNTMLSSAGRVAYMSPEQAARGAVDSRSDLFSVGVMMWEAITRRRFWSEEASKVEIVRALAAGELPPSRVSALASTPGALRSIVVRATEPAAADRYASAAAFQSDLRAALRELTPPTFDLRDLGKRVVTIFAAERARLQAAINAPHEDGATGVGGERAEPPSSQPLSVPAPSSGPPPSGPPSSLLPQSVLPLPTAPPRIVPPPSIPPPSGMPASIPPPGTSRWRPNFQDVAIGAIAVAALVGVGLSALQRRSDDVASAATKTAASLPAIPAVHATDEASRAAAPAPVGTRAEETPVASAPLEATASAPPDESAPPDHLSAAARSDGHLRPAELPVVHAHAASPAAPPPHAASGAPPAPARPAVTAASPSVEVPVPENRPATPRPSRPIDALNPYAP
jgi:serine/threonine protein kinase